MAELAVTGAEGGALAAVLSMVLRHPSLVLELDVPWLGTLLASLGIFGAFLGALLGPLAGKTVLRGVPLVRGVGWTAVGTALAVAFAPKPGDGESMVPVLISPFVGFLVTAVALWAWEGMSRQLERSGVAKDAS